MASIEDRPTNDSSRSHTFRVIWKENGRRTTETFTTRKQKQLITRTPTGRAITMSGAMRAKEVAV